MFFIQKRKEKHNALTPKSLPHHKQRGRRDVTFPESQFEGFPYLRIHILFRNFVIGNSVRNAVLLMFTLICIRSIKTVRHIYTLCKNEVCHDTSKFDIMPFPQLQTVLRQLY